MENCQVKNAKAQPPNRHQTFKIVKESYYFASTYQNIYSDRCPAYNLSIWDVSKAVDKIW